MFKNDSYLKRIGASIMVFGFLLTLGYLFCFVGSAYGNVTRLTTSSEKENERALLKWKAKLEKENKLYSYAIKTFKSPIKSQAFLDKDPECPENYFLFIFSSGSEFKVETLQPSITIFSLKTLKGFPDEKKAIIVLKQCVRDYKLDLNWEKPKERYDGEEKTVKYEAFSDGDNSAATLVYKNEHLVEIGFHCFL